MSNRAIFFYSLQLDSISVRRHLVFEIRATIHKIMDIKAKRSAVIALFEAGKNRFQIFKELKNSGYSKDFVYRAVKCYQETGSVERKRKVGSRTTVCTPANVKRVRQALQRNPRRSVNQMATKLEISQTSLRRIMKNKLQVKAYKIQKVQDLTAAQKKVRLERAKALKARHARSELNNLVFSDEKIFTVQQIVNKQNDRVYLKDRSSIGNEHLLAFRKQKPASLMVWAAITRNGRSPLVFVPEGCKINAQVYRELILEGALEPWTRKHFGSEPYVFQQDSAPAHKAKETVRWLQNHVPDFISPAMWPPYSPDLNPMDFSIWGILEAKVSAKKYDTVEGLKNALVREWKRIPQSVVCAAYDSFFDRLDRIILFKGDHIEN